MAVDRKVIRQVKALIAGAETVDSGGLGTRQPPRIHAGGPFRAVQRQEIHRIARWYGWQGEVDSALAAGAAASLAGLDDAALGILHARMQLLEGCAQHGLDSPDSPPAR